MRNGMLAPLYNNFTRISVKSYENIGLKLRPESPVWSRSAFTTQQTRIAGEFACATALA
jgi:hypothetical protein